MSNRLTLVEIKELHFDTVTLFEEYLINELDRTADELKMLEESSAEEIEGLEEQVGEIRATGESYAQEIESFADELAGMLENPGDPEDFDFSKAHDMATRIASEAAELYRVI